MTINRGKLQSRWMGHIKPAITKRISKDFEPFREDAEAIKHEIFDGNYLRMIGYFKQKYNLSLADATNFTVAFNGVYNNADRGYGIFTTERYELGMKVRDRLVK